MLELLAQVLAEVVVYVFVEGLFRLLRFIFDFMWKMLCFIPNSLRAMLSPSSSKQRRP
jgi:hypothetical protein